jgi:hypothetical protein
LEAHVYKTRLGLLIFCLIGGIAMILLGAIEAALPLFTVVKGPVVIALLGLGLVLMGAAILRGALKYRVTLRSASIEVDNGFPFGIGLRRIAREDIVAKGYVRQYLLLYPTDKSRRPLGVGLTVTQDAYFQKWMASIPLADAQFFEQRRQK